MNNETFKGLQKGVDLSSLNTFRVPCVAEHYLAFSNLQELEAGLQQYDETGQSADKVFILGGGSNILLGQTLSGLVLHPKNSSITVVDETADEVQVSVGSGCEWDGFVAIAVKNGWRGVECLTLIPGNVGASVVQNIGAYGAEASQCVASVYCFNLQTRQAETLSCEACEFDYRLSIFKRRPELVVLEVTYRLKKQADLPRALPLKTFAILKEIGQLLKLGWQSVRIGRATGFKPKMHFDKVRQLLKLEILPIRLKRALVKFIRTKTMPDPKVVANVGCFFKSPIVNKIDYERQKAMLSGVGVYEHGEDQIKVSAGDLIKLTKLNGLKRGNVHVEQNRPLIIISNGKASGSEIQEFASFIQGKVLARTAIKIEPEVVILEN